MRLFIKRSVLFLLLLAVLSAAADYIFSLYLRKINEPYIASWDDILHRRIDSDFIILGSSRAMGQINPEIMDSVLHTHSYNLGVIGAHVDLQLVKYDLYRSCNRSPESIVFSIDYFSLEHSMQYIRYQFFPFFWDFSVRKAVFPIYTYTKAERFIPLARYGIKDLVRAAKPRSGYLRRGFSDQDSGWRGDFLGHVDFNTEDNVTKAFESFLDQAAAEGVRIALVFPPAVFRAGDDYFTPQEMLDYYEAYAERYDNIHTLDYSRMSISRDSSCFFDNVHLNARGARIFSDTLASDLLELGFGAN